EQHTQILGLAFCNQRSDYGRSRAFALHPPREIKAMPQESEHALRDGGTIFRSGKTMRARPIAQESIRRLFGGLQLFEDINGGLEACGRGHVAVIPQILPSVKQNLP